MSCRVLCIDRKNTLCLVSPVEIECIFEANALYLHSGMHFYGVNCIPAIKQFLFVAKSLMLAACNVVNMEQ